MLRLSSHQSRQSDHRHTSKTNRWQAQKQMFNFWWYPSGISSSKTAISKVPEIQISMLKKMLLGQMMKRTFSTKIFNMHLWKQMLRKDYYTHKMFTKEVISAPNTHICKVHHLQKKGNMNLTLQQNLHILAKMMSFVVKLRIIISQILQLVPQEDKCMIAP